MADTRFDRLAVRLRRARLRANSQRKLSKSQQRAPQLTMAKRHQPLTQAVVAREMGISQSLLSKIQKGQLEPGFLLVGSLARYHGVKLSAVATYLRDDLRDGHHLNH